MGVAAGVSAGAVRRWAQAVLEGEGVGAATISVTFLSSQRMRALNRRSLGRDRATDVIAFPLRHPGVVAGDIYICPGVARRSAREADISTRQEILRLVIHGLLHVLGHDHPQGGGRTRSRMWRVQERWVQRLAAGASP